MNIRCHTNLDLNPCEQWPNELPCRPMVGDIITSSTGLELEVCRIVFKYGENYCLPCVELHIPPYRFENLTAFEKWYRNRR